MPIKRKIRNIIGSLVLSGAAIGLFGKALINRQHAEIKPKTAITEIRKTEKKLPIKVRKENLRYVVLEEAQKRGLNKRNVKALIEAESDFNFWATNKAYKGQLKVMQRPEKALAFASNDFIFKYASDLAIGCFQLKPIAIKDYFQNIERTRNPELDAANIIRTFFQEKTQAKNSHILVKLSQIGLAYWGLTKKRMMIFLQRKRIKIPSSLEIIYRNRKIILNKEEIKGIFTYFAYYWGYSRAKRYLSKAGSLNRAMEIMLKTPAVRRYLNKLKGF